MSKGNYNEIPLPVEEVPERQVTARRGRARAPRSTTDGSSRPPSVSSSRRGRARSATREPAEIKEETQPLSSPRRARKNTLTSPRKDATPKNKISENWALVFEVAPETRFTKWLKKTIIPLFAWIWTAVILRCVRYTRKALVLLNTSVVQPSRAFWTRNKAHLHSFADKAIAKVKAWAIDVHDTIQTLDDRSKMLTNWISVANERLSAAVERSITFAQHTWIKPAGKKSAALIKQVANWLKEAVKSVLLRLRSVFHRGLSAGRFQLDIVPSHHVKDNYFALDDGQAYEIYISNGSFQSCTCTIEVDGEQMGTFLLQPHKSAFIERPSHTAARFTFIKDPSATAETFHAGAVDIGSVVRATFVEYQNVWGRATKSPTTVDPLEENFDSSGAIYSSGRTVLAGHTDQHVRQTALGRNVRALPPVTIIARLIAK